MVPQLKWVLAASCYHPSFLWSIHSPIHPSSLSLHLRLRPAPSPPRIPLLYSHWRRGKRLKTTTNPLPYNYPPTSSVCEFCTCAADRQPHPCSRPWPARPPPPPVSMHEHPLCTVPTQPTSLVSHSFLGHSSYRCTNLLLFLPHEKKRTKKRTGEALCAQLPPPRTATLLERAVHLHP